MKKIWPWLLLLLLLIILCVWTKKDSMHVSSDNHSQAREAVPMVIDDVRYIDYVISQEGESYTLNGNFKDTKQQTLFTDTFTAASKELVIKNTSTNGTLSGDTVIELTHSILPHFIANYAHGKITYSEQKLKIFGSTHSYEAQHEMQRLLNLSRIASQDNSSVLTIKPITYTIDKTVDTLHMTGTFNSDTQMNAIKSLLPAHATTDLNAASNHVDNGSLPVVNSLMPIFLSNYTQGSIVYSDEKLTLSGMVQSNEDIEKIKSILSTSTIPVTNNTIVDPAVKAAALQAEAEEKAKLMAEKAAMLQAKKLLDEENAKKATALQAEADEKARLVQEKLAKQAEEDALNAKNTEMKTKIINLFKVGNIEFTINKSTLTDKGQNTLNKLASILKEYPAINIEIAGHTDSDGSAKYNQKLSQSRVDMVKNKLIAQTINASRLTAKGYGETKPLVENTTDENKAKNRRVEINIQGE